MITNIPLSVTKASDSSIVSQSPNYSPQSPSGNRGLNQLVRCVRSRCLTDALELIEEKLGLKGDAAIFFVSLINVSLINVGVR